MKFKKFKKLSYRQKVPNSEAQYEYIRKVGQFEETLSPFKSLKYYMRTNNLHTVNKKLHNYIATSLSSFDVPYYNELTYKQKTNAKAYYECLVEALTGVGEVFKISGVISDGTDPISGATVVCDEETVTTSSDGAYEFTGLLPGRYYVKVSATHYDDKQSQVTISSADVERNITLDLCEFTVSGVISDDQETPEVVVGATVTLDGVETVTDENGAYSFAYVAKGEHELTVTAEHYDDKTSQVTVSNSDVTKNITLSLCEFTVSGVVSDDQETPEPVSGAVVKLDDLEFTTESDGEFEFTFVSKGEHNLLVTADGFDDEETTVTVSNADVTKNITLTTSTE